MPANSRWDLIRGLKGYPTIVMYLSDVLTKLPSLTAVEESTSLKVLRASFRHVPVIPRARGCYI